MLRISLAFLSVALLLASTAQGSDEGRRGRAARWPCRGWAPAAASGSKAAGTASSSRTRPWQRSSPRASVRTPAASSIATGFGTNPAVAYYGMGSTPTLRRPGRGTAHTASTAAAFSGVGGYGVVAGSNPYAQVNNTYGNTDAGFGAMNGMNDGSSSFYGNEFHFMSDPFAAALAAAEWSSTDTTPRTRSKATKPRFKVKPRSKRTKVASH